ncbi:hypothetical protein [Bacteroides reticulotermitis]|uniref:hypothetical protein n=1 Tax=Bacteroides reticulotermitis TaxID=1133319 RepID=UPI003A8C3C9D
MNNIDLNEQQIMQYFDDKFGKSIPHRMIKLREEEKELDMAEFVCSASRDGKGKDEFLDEVSDVLAVITHLGHCLGYTHGELLNMSYEKCRIRETDPDYKHSK